MTRVFVIGIDGADYNLIKKGIHLGYLPTIEYISKEGFLLPLKSIIPPLSAPAWNSIFTGTWPNKHGIYGFLLQEKKSYNFRIARSYDRRVNPIWKILSLRGERVILENVPSSYPPEPVKGLIITGLGTPGMNSNFTYPRFFRNIILKKFPKYKVGTIVVNEIKNFKSYTPLIDSIRDKLKLIQHLLKKKSEWSLFITVFNFIDILSHYVLSEKTLLEAYILIDKIIKTIISSVPNDTNFLICSDHGTRPVKYTFYLGNWLIKEGFMNIRVSKLNYLYHKLDLLDIKSTLSKLKLGNLLYNFEDIFFSKNFQFKFLSNKYYPLSNCNWSKTYAFYYYGGKSLIKLNVTGREPCGIVMKDNIEVIKQKIKNRLINTIGPDDRSPVKGVFFTEQLYGKSIDMPEIAVLGNDLYSISGYGDYGRIFGRSKIVRDHSLYGVFLGIGPNICNVWNLNPTLVDIMPTILKILNLKTPSYVDGKAIIE